MTYIIRRRTTPKKGLQINLVLSFNHFQPDLGTIPVWCVDERKFARFRICSFLLSNLETVDKVWSSHNSKISIHYNYLLYTNTMNTKPSYEEHGLPS